MKKLAALALAIVMTLLCSCAIIDNYILPDFGEDDETEANPNVVVAGALDANLKYNGENTDENTLMFMDIWEPGAVSYGVFEVENIGSLAFDYSLELSCGEAYALENILRVAVVDKVLDSSVTREALMELFEEGGDYVTLSEFKLKGVLEADTASGEFTVVVCFHPDDSELIDQTETAGCRMNAKLYVTQMTAEEDSFGAQYDQ